MWLLYQIGQWADSVKIYIWRTTKLTNSRNNFSLFLLLSPVFLFLTILFWGVWTQGEYSEQVLELFSYYSKSRHNKILKRPNDRVQRIPYKYTGSSSIGKRHNTFKIHKLDRLRNHYHGKNRVQCLCWDLLWHDIYGFLRYYFSFWNMPQMSSSE